MTSSCELRDLRRPQINLCSRRLESRSEIWQIKDRADGTQRKGHCGRGSLRATRGAIFLMGKRERGNHASYRIKRGWEWRLRKNTWIYHFLRGVYQESLRLWKRSGRFVYIIWGWASMMEPKEIKVQETWHMKTKNSYSHRAPRTFRVNTESRKGV